MPINTDLKGKRAVVTGGSKGIGKEIALRFAMEGADVLIMARNPDTLNSALGELTAINPRCLCFAGNVNILREVKAMRDFIKKEWGAVDILVNNAGIFPVTPFTELSFEQWHEVIDINLNGAFYCSKLIVELMTENKVKGNIINISSTSSLLARPGIAHYASTKAALSNFSRVLAVELAPYGIRVNTVIPGLINTDTVTEALTSPLAVAEHETKLRRIPLKRAGEAREIASAALFLVSDEAAYITGSSICVDGGYTLGIPSYGDA